MAASVRPARRAARSRRLASRYRLHPSGLYLQPFEGMPLAALELSCIAAARLFSAVWRQRSLSSLFEAVEQSGMSRLLEEKKFVSRSEYFSCNGTLPDTIILAHMGNGHCRSNYPSGSFCGTHSRRSFMTSGCRDCWNSPRHAAAPVPTNIWGSKHFR